MKRIRLELLFILQAIAWGIVALMFSWAREPGLAALFLLNANLCILIYEVIKRK